MKRILVLVMAAAFVVAACSSTEDAVDAYCDDLSSLASALQEGQSLTASSTVDDVQQVRDDVTSAYDDAVSSAQDVDDAVTGEIQSAQQAFSDAVGAIPDDSSVSDGLAAVQTAWTQYVSAVDAAISQVNCSS